MRFGEISCDVLVIGHGAAGCMAGIALARRGREVIIIGRGTTSTALSTGRLWLGSELREDQALSSSIADIGRPHRWFANDIGPVRAITNIGTLARQDLCTAHDWFLELGRPTAVVGLNGNLDLDPDLACRALAEAKTGANCHPYWLDPPELAGVRCGVLAGQDGAIIDALAPCLGELREEAVVLPPLFAGLDNVGKMDRLAEASGREIFEPMTPLSLPGLRLQTALEQAARESGCLLWKDIWAEDISASRDRGTRALLRSGLRDLAVRPRAFVVATGNLVGGGLGLTGRTVTPMLDALATETITTAALGSAALSEALSTGLQVVDGRAVGREGEVLGNVFPAGSSVAGLSFPLGKGLGAVMASGLQAARRAEEVL